MYTGPQAANRRFGIALGFQSFVNATLYSTLLIAIDQ
jgi:hypothetical protein